MNGSLSPVPRGSQPTMSKLLEQVGAVDELGRLGEDRPAEPGSARVDEQRADARVGVGGEVADEVQAERAGVGVGVVDRHLETALLESVAERRPFDRLRLERRERRRNRFGGRRRCGGLDHFGRLAGLGGLDGSVVSSLGDLGGRRRLGGVGSGSTDGAGTGGDGDAGDEERDEPEGARGRIMGGILEAPCGGHPAARSSLTIAEEQSVRLPEPAEGSASARP